ncbi:MAG: hypothetical protein AAF732_02590 [Pseudomonadota bacterium]
MAYSWIDHIACECAEATPNVRVHCRGSWISAIGYGFAATLTTVLIVVPIVVVAVQLAVSPQFAASVMADGATISAFAKLIVAGLCGLAAVVWCAVHAWRAGSWRLNVEIRDGHVRLTRHTLWRQTSQVLPLTTFDGLTVRPYTTVDGRYEILQLCQGVKGLAIPLCKGTHIPMDFARDIADRLGMPLLLSSRDGAMAHVAQASASAATARPMLAGT